MYICIGEWAMAKLVATEEQREENADIFLVQFRTTISISERAKTLCTLLYATIMILTEKLLGIIHFMDVTPVKIQPEISSFSTYASILLTSFHCHIRFYTTDSLSLPHTLLYC
jgi:hypothetical protein